MRKLFPILIFLLIIRLSFSANFSSSYPISNDVTSAPSFSESYDISSNIVSPPYDTETYTVSSQISGVPSFSESYDTSVNITTLKFSNTTSFNVTANVYQPFNFSVNVVEDRVSLQPSICKDIHIEVRTTSPQNVSTVYLYAYDLPENVSITFDPQAGIPDFDSVGTLCAGDVIPYGTYIVTISGVSGNISANDTFELELTTIVFDFSIDVSPVNLTLVQNTTGNYNVYVNLVEGTPQEVTLSLQNYPSGLTYYFSPDKVVPSGQSTLTVNATVPIGYYEMYVVGTWDGIARSKKIGLNVVERIPLNFNLRIVPDKQTIYKPGSTQYTIYVDYISGTREPVYLSVSGLPSGVTYNFSQSSVIPSGSSLLTIEASGEAEDGNYTFTVCGSSSESTVCDTAELEIKTLIIPLQFLFEDPYIIIAIILGVIAGYVGRYSTPISIGIFSTAFVIYSFYNYDILCLLIPVSYTHLTLPTN